MHLDVCYLKYYLPVTQSNSGTEHNSLSDKKRDEFRNLFKDLEIVIVDELSMVSADMLYRLSLRLQEIFISLDLFGGKIIIFVGDPMQLKPVQARYIYGTPSCNKYLPLHTMHPLWQKFKVIVFKTNHRQGHGTSWCEILNRARIGELTEADKDILRSRNLKLHPNVDFENAWHVYYTNMTVKTHNMKKLKLLAGSIIKIPAKLDYPKGYSPKIKECETE